MKARLFRAGSDRGEPFEFGAEATIGRGTENSMLLEPVAVSNRHARIYFDSERRRYYLEDLDSLNGTKLDGVELTRPEPLDRLHVIEFGGDGLELVFQALDLTPPAEAGESAPEAAASGTAVDREMPELPASLADDAADAEETQPIEGTSADREMPEVPPELLEAIDEEETVLVDDQAAGESGGPETAAGPDVAEPLVVEGARFFLQLHEPPDSEPIPLSRGSRVIGRARAADVCVESVSVSRRHALLTVGDRVTVRDLGSRNHTFVNDVRVDDEVEIKPGTKLQFGSLGATLIVGEAPE